MSDLNELLIDMNNNIAALDAKSQEFDEVLRDIIRTLGVLAGEVEKLKQPSIWTPR